MAAAAANVGLEKRIASCAVRSDPMSSPRVHPDLLALAGQYFQTGHDGGFDAFRSDARQADRRDQDVVFPWFDVWELQKPVLPPPGVRIVRSLRSGYLVTRSLSGKCCRDELGYLKRGQETPRWFGVDLYPTSAVQARSGEIWTIAHGASSARQDKPSVRLLHLRVDGGLENESLDVSDSARNATLALTADDKPALVYLRRDGGRLRLMLSWSLDLATAIPLDEVEVPIAVAELSQRSGVSVSVAADGDRGIGLAWRPLTDQSSTGSSTVLTAAEVRWLTFEPSGPATRIRQYSTKAEPVSFRSGIGPYGLAGNGLKASILDGHAFFAWIEGADIVGLRSTDDIPTPIARATGVGEPLIGLVERSEGLDLILFKSTPLVTAFHVRCD